MPPSRLCRVSSKGLPRTKELAEAKALDRESQFYWEFVMVENSEGAHNPQLSNACLDRAQSLAEQALALLV